MKKAFVFDFDDTLATTDCKVQVRSFDNFDINAYKSLTSAEYNSYQLGPKEYFDYSDFKCGNKITEASATSLIHLAKEVHDENHDVYVLTARSNACADAIKKFLELRMIKPKFVFCVGDNNKAIEESKRNVLLTLLQGYDKLYFYDDYKGNIDSAPDDSKIRKYLV
tara:strand:+ start:406 stop:903 length:498 start_codon:yes stop_codon:yes gene_type:complete